MLTGIFLDNYITDSATTRLKYFGGAASTPITALIDTLSLALLVPLNIATLGLNKSISKLTKHQLGATSYITYLPLRYALSTLNPSAPIELKPTRNQVTTGLVQRQWEELCDKTNNGSFFERLLMGKIGAIPFALAFTVARITDLALSCILIPTAFLTYGKYATINEAAINAFRPLGLLSDLYKCASALIFIPESIEAPYEIK